MITNAPDEAAQGLAPDMAQLLVRLETALSKGEEAAELLTAKHDLLVHATRNTIQTLDQLIDAEVVRRNG